MSGAIAALFVGSIFVGVAVATTGAPVLYDARSPQPVATESGGFGVEAGEATGDPQVPADGADDDGEAPLPRTHSNPPIASPSPAPSAPPVPSPAPSPPPADPVPTADEQQAWLAFQQLVRECMAGADQEYRFWEWWNTEPRNPTSTAPAMPEGLSTEQQQAWRLALEGDGDDGCIGEATRADQQPPASGMPPPPAPPPAESVAPPAESGAPAVENEAPAAGTEAPPAELRQ
ncbi:hypothetical protein [Agromyces subbeticus]|uniref:hypothetical protein n=1 Tax=Agromyces subbeticus TaxID=293890 RepID=UPI0012EC6475|nr:hypothetical protein [Agromyces subbeticus]